MYDKSLAFVAYKSEAFIATPNEALVKYLSNRLNYNHF